MTPRTRRPRVAAGGFSLVEVTLALGVVGFALVAIVGILPVAFTTGRTSIAQTRATALADTVFAGLRAEPFAAAVPGRGLELAGATLPTVDLSRRQTVASANGPDADGLTLFAVLTETGAGAETDPRYLRFATDRQAMLDALDAVPGAARSGYELNFRFDPTADGAPPVAQPDGTTRGRASRIVLVVRPAAGGANDVFRFATVLADRGMR